MIELPNNNYWLGHTIPYPSIEKPTILSIQVSKLEALEEMGYKFYMLTPSGNYMSGLMPYDAA